MMLRRLHILACAKSGSCALGPFSVGYTMSISGHLRALTEFLRTTGQISIVDVRDGKLLIAMSGGCQGCTASQVTLKNGFELMVRRVAPEIVDIIDTTDHASGTKPFYQHAGQAR